MLKLKNVSKTYVSKKNVSTKALNNVNVQFNKGEFVSIFGPSGSGKTTLLNIIGGFDRFDDGGEIYIEDISTSMFKDANWDNYRNNKVGFVFQDYNLLEQLTAIENVELALAFSNTPQKTKRKMAQEALKKVNLLEQQDKYPSELSGGQMQCVALARSIVKDPDIILADEPTGSLDSKTSEHIMDTLKKISKDRLVIIATHNSDLAKKYSTHIYSMKDGKLSADAEILNNKSDNKTSKSVKSGVTSATKILNDNKIKTKKTALSYTASYKLGLASLLNTKLKTLAMLAAGCIGVFLVATIIAIANGMNSYVVEAQNTTLAQYPVTLGQNRDLSKVDSYVKVSQEIADNAYKEHMTKSEQRNKVLEEAKRQHKVALNNVLASMMSTSGESTTQNNASTLNDLRSFKSYLDKNPNNINDKVCQIEYAYRTSPVIYMNNSNDVKELYPSDGMFGSLGSNSGSSYTSNSKAGKTSAFTADKLFSNIGPLPKNSDLYKDDECLVAGHWPSNPYECLLVLKEDGTIDDTMLYVLGMRDFKSEVEPLLEKYKNNEKVDFPGQFDTYNYSDFLGRSLKVINPSDCYRYFDQTGLWVDMSADTEYMKGVIDKAKDLSICGIVIPSAGTRAASYLNIGVQFPYELNEISIEMTKNSDVVKAQQASPDVDILTGEKFSYLAQSKNIGEKLQGKRFVNINLEMFAQSFKINPEALSFDTDKGKSKEAEITEEQIIKMIQQILEDPKFQEMVYDMLQDGHYEETTLRACIWAAQSYLDYISSGGTMSPSEWFASPQGAYVVDTIIYEIPEAMRHDVEDFLDKWGPSFIEEFLKEFEEEIKESLTEVLEFLLDDSPDLIEFDPDKFSKIIGVDVTLDDMKQLMYSISGASNHTYMGNLADFGYDEMVDPVSIAIYPNNYNDKQVVLDTIDEYNDQMVETDQDNKFVTYNDDAGAAIGAAQGIIAVIAAIIIFFVSSVFVTSTILIGVIFGVSTLQRRREIGILRALGARRRDISRMFNTESSLIGLLAGIVGVLLSFLLCCVINAAANADFTVAVLSIGVALALIIVSAALILIAGFVPSFIASKKDPVKAIKGL